tara:strand:- start:132 stop:749 length:618 start_codon:yes stop_codon:yes gene_type:complete
MNLKYNYWFFPKAISKKTCSQIIKKCEKQKVSKAIVSAHKDVSKSRSDLKVRNSKIRWISDTWIYDLINPFIHGANRNAGWNFQWDWNEAAQFTEYRKNQFYDWHIDQHWQPFLPTDPNQNVRNKTRKISLTLQLTDPSKYTGGNFEFMWFDTTAKNNVKKTIAKEARELGTIIIFPSFVWHRILPVTKGKRQSLVNWSVGKVFD